MYGLAAVYIFSFATLIYNDLNGPEPLGFVADYSGGSPRVATLNPDSALGQAGFQPGDWIRKVDNQEVKNHADWLAVRTNLEVGRPVRVEVERGAERVELVLKPRRESRELRHRMLYLSARSSGVILLLLAFLIAFNRPYWLDARIGALLLAGMAVSSPDPPLGLAALWRQFPTPLTVLLWVAALVSQCSLAPLLFTFFAIFPRRLLHSRRAWLLAWMPIMLAAPAMLPYFYAMVFRPQSAAGLGPGWLLPTVVMILVGYVVAALVALVVNYRRLSDPNERRRVRVLVAGTVIGWLALLPGLIINYLPSATPLKVVYVTSPLSALPFVLFPLFPLSFAYAILRHRVLDVGLLIRQGLQYAFARRILLSVVPALIVVLLVDLWLHGDQPLKAILVARGWIYGALGVLAVVAHRRRQDWLAALDRRFFRERYNAQQLLRELVEEIRNAASLDRVAQRLVSQIENALHPEFVALMTRPSGAPHYTARAVSPAGQAPPPLSADSKLIALLGLLDKPLEISLQESSWLRKQLPAAETTALRESHIDLLVPIATRTERLQGLLVLGPKLSEEPYSNEDQDWLQALAGGVALLLERSAPLSPHGFGECPQCGTCYPAETERCESDHTALAQQPFSRQIAGRYRLEQRIGQGGMGTVYRATDGELERPVAVKLLREHLLATSDSIDRFRRESRAAAGFAHPNLVTVHDTGIHSATRPFLVMELLSGVTLRQELSARGKLTPARTLEILRGVCAGVEAAHSRQLVHRDLKPENIFLFRPGSAEIPKVLDFGIAKPLANTLHATAETGAGFIAGTLRYMSPEQLGSQPVDVSWDLWALGVIAYEMLAGTFPFANSSLEGRFVSITTHRPDAPAAWQQFFSRAFHADRSERPQSVSALLSQMEQALR